MTSTLLFKWLKLTAVNRSSPRERLACKGAHSTSTHREYTAFTSVSSLPRPLQMPPASRLYPRVIHHSSFKSSNEHHSCVVFLSWVCGSVVHSKTLARVRPLPVPTKSLEETITVLRRCRTETRRGAATCPGSHNYPMKARTDMKLFYPGFVF